MASAASPLSSYDAARRAMIDSQLRTSGINEAWVLARFAAIPREDFVPDAARAAAYTDRAVQLEGGRMLPAPLFHARLLAEGKPSLQDRVLVVDAGSGYLPALLQGLAGSVIVIAPADALKSAKGGDFTLLLIDGAVEHLPDVLTRRLADDARVVTGLIEDGVARLAIGRKAAGTVGLLPLSEMGIPRLPAFDKPKAWSF
jgi:protein-L-isoaspartate(D-aspartate) O-methyltransferase